MPIASSQMKRTFFGSSERPARGGRHAAQGKPRPLRVENLEQRSLLSAAPLSTLAAAKAAYPHLDPNLLELADPALKASAVDVGGPAAHVVAENGSSMSFDAAGRVNVEITAQDVLRLMPSLGALGFQVTGTSAAQHLVEGYLPIASLAAANGLASQGLMGVVPLYRPALSDVGSYTDQANNILEADRVHAATPGYDGTGVKIGALSDSYNDQGTAAADVASGDLPANVQVLQDYGGGGTDEGRAMLQLIHHVAPGSPLAFATADEGDASFAQNIKDLADPTQGHCKIIVDDVTYFNEPFFQDGIIAQAVDDVVTNDHVAYFSSAGNNQDQAYESTNVQFVTDTIAGISSSPASYYAFDAGTGADMQEMTIAAGQTVRFILQWDQPFYTTNGVKTELDMYLLDHDTGQVLLSATDNTITGQEPLQFLGATNNGGSPANVDLVICKSAGPAVGRIKYVNFSNGDPVTFDDYATNSPTISPHAAAADAMAVAAAPYYNQRTPEYYTSEGPATILFTAAGDPQTPEVRAKPDITSIDGTTTTFFGFDIGDGAYHFFGTSAAAPHAAAVAALVWQVNPSFTPAQVYSRLKTTADPNVGGTPGNPNLVGAGLIDAYRAVLGQPVPATTNVSDGFESGTLAQDWQVYDSGAGRTQAVSTNGPETGAYQLAMDGSADDTVVQSFYDSPALSEAILHVDAAGASDLSLAFDQKEFNDSDDPMPATFSGHGNYDGVALSVDGVHWYLVDSLTGSASTNSYQHNTFDLSQIAAADGLTLGADTQIKFQHYSASSGPIPSQGFAFDNVQVTGISSGPLLSIDNVSHKEGNSGTTKFNFVVTLSTAANQPVTVQYATANGTAAAPGDYTAKSGTLTFNAGQTQQTVTVLVKGNKLHENDETFLVNLFGATGGAAVGQGTGTGTIQNDDPPPTLSIGNVSLKEGNSGTTSFNFVVSLSTASGAPATVAFATADGSATTADNDYQATSGTVTFAPGQTKQTIVVLVNGDTKYEANETFAVNLSAPGGAAITKGKGTGTIQNDDKPPVLTITDTTASETAAPTRAIFTVTLSPASGLPTTVPYATIAGTAKAGRDFTATTGTLTFAAGQTTQTISVPILADSSLKSAETFSVKLSAPKQATLGAKSKGTCTIEASSAIADALAAARLPSAQISSQNQRQAADEAIRLLMQV